MSAASTPSRRVITKASSIAVPVLGPAAAAAVRLARAGRDQLFDVPDALVEEVADVVVVESVVGNAARPPAAHQIEVLERAELVRDHRRRSAEEPGQVAHAQ